MEASRGHVQQPEKDVAAVSELALVSCSLRGHLPFWNVSQLSQKYVVGYRPTTTCVETDIRLCECVS